jgi:SAM-dependent methyltransferase
VERDAQQVAQQPGAGPAARRRTTFLKWALLLTALLALASALLPENADEYNPQVGEKGKDVLWAPAPPALVERMLDMAELTAKDIHYDLGSGDGRTVIAAAKRGARAYGIEYNPEMVALSERMAAREGVARRTKFIHGDIFETDFSHATVLTLYLLPALNEKLRPTILKMKPGTRVLSLDFSMGDWKADRIEKVEANTAYLWIVPAQVAGTWRWSLDGGGPRENRITLKQRYQQLEGTARLDGEAGELRNLELAGDRLAFSIVEPGAAGPVQRHYAGRVDGDTVEGTVKHSGGEAKWSATRERASR